LRKGLLLSSSRRWGGFFLLALLGVIFGFIISSNLGFVNWGEAEPQVRQVQSQHRSIYPITPDGRSPFVAVVEAVRDAVVNIKAERQQQLDPYHRSWLEFWGFRPQDQMEVSMGSGFFFRPDGYILTNSHVVTGGQEITVTLADGSEKKAKLVGEDRSTDLAVIQIGGYGYSYIELGNSDSIKVGEWVLAIGNPFPTQGLDRTVTVGVISAKGRRGLNFGQDSPEYQDYIQTDAAINPGNSGGPLVNLDGYVIGINSAIASTAGQSAGIGFAIPSNLARNIATQLMTEGRVSRGWLGVILSNIDMDIAEANGLTKPHGILIREVVPNSPAARAGIEVGDIITKYNGTEVVDTDHFRYLVAGSEQGSKVTLVAQRRGKPTTIIVTIGDQDKGFASVQNTSGSRTADNTRPSDDKIWLGMSVETATRDLAEHFGVEYRDGVIVTYVQSGSPADVKEITPGTILFEVNHVEVNGADDFYRIKSDLADRTKAIAFLGYDLRGNVRYFAIKP
jgi:serine protease Do